MHIYIAFFLISFAFSAYYFPRGTLQWRKKKHFMKRSKVTTGEVVGIIQARHRARKQVAQDGGAMDDFDIETISTGGYAGGNAGCFYHIEFETDTKDIYTYRTPFSFSEPAETVEVRYIIHNDEKIDIMVNGKIEGAIGVKNSFYAGGIFAICALALLGYIVLG